MSTPTIDREPDAYHKALSNRASEIKRNLVDVIDRNPTLEPGLRGRLVTIVGKVEPLTDPSYLALLEDAWRPEEIA